MDTAVMVVENVLRVSGSGKHINEGVTLYRSLAAGSRLYLLSHEWDQIETEAWLFDNSLRGNIGFQRAISSSPADRIDALSRIISWTPALVVEPDPECAVEEVRAGYTVCLFGRPAYAEARWRPDATKGPKPWDVVVAELERQRDLRFADARLKEI